MADATLVAVREKLGLSAAAQLPALQAAPLPEPQLPEAQQPAAELPAPQMPEAQQPAADPSAPRPPADLTPEQ
jgi:hypothetical protein